MTKFNVFLSLLFLMNTSDALIFNFTKEANLASWKVVDDGVMGGRSQGNFAINEAGNAVFEGTVSLDNYGGFSSVRHAFPEKDVAKYSKVLLRVKGDGKKYQFRIKEKRLLFLHHHISDNYRMANHCFRDASNVSCI